MLFSLAIFNQYIMTFSKFRQFYFIFYDLDRHSLKLQRLSFVTSLLITPKLELWFTLPFWISSNLSILELSHGQRYSIDALLYLNNLFNFDCLHFILILNCLMPVFFFVSLVLYFCIFILFEWLVWLSMAWLDFIHRLMRLFLMFKANFIIYSFLKAILTIFIVDGLIK